jgi:hypothetical protein
VTFAADNLKSVGGYLSISSNVTFAADNLKSVGGYLSISSNVTLPKLTSVGGDLYISSKLPIKTERILWKVGHKRKWYMTDQCSEWMLEREGNIIYKINNVQFEKELFDKVRKDQLTAAGVFAINNMEQRRIAYEKMNKAKMSALPNLKVLDTVKDDGYGYPMRVISFTIEGYDKPFRFLNCFCPSTGREYHPETQQNTCHAAKSKSFGFDSIEFDKEY